MSAFLGGSAGLAASAAGRRPKMSLLRMARDSSAARGGALGATFLFGLLEAISNRYPNLEIGPVTIPSMFMNALPYILTVIILAGFVGRAIPPRAGGEPYVKER